MAPFILFYFHSFTMMRTINSKQITKTLLHAALVVSATASHAQVAHLELTIGSRYSADEHYDVTYTPENSDYFYAWVWGKTPSGEANYLSFDLGNSGMPTNQPSLFLQFSTAMLDQPLVVGTYANTERASFATAGHAGFDIGFYHSGNNAVWGSFTIEKATYSIDGKVQ